MSLLLASSLGGSTTMHQAIERSNAASGPSCKCRRVCVVRALNQRSEGAKLQQATCTLLAAGLSFGLTMTAPVAPAEAALLSAPGGPQTEAVDAEIILEEERGRVEYSMGLQDNARRARLLAKRQLFENQLEQVDDAIQRKLTEERANALAAKAQGDEKLAESVQVAAADIDAQAKAVQLAAAKIEAQLDRADMLERARAIQEQQSIQRAAAAALQSLAKSAPALK